MLRANTVTIVGAGLIGGSIGLALKQRKLAAHVIGVGRQAASLRQAKQGGAVDQTTTDLAKGVRRADLVVVCTPVDTIAPLVRQVAAACPPRCLITDAGSTKAPLVEQLKADLPSGARFVASHPLAGSEQRGPEHAQADLFQNRVTVVTPTRSTRAQDLNEVTRFWQALGAEVIRMSPEAHDRALARTSHLPHLAAAAIASATPRRYAPLVASGWRDTTRVAAGDPELWRQIMQSNREELLASLEVLQDELAAWHTALEQDDSRKLLQLLAKAKRTRDALGN